MKKYYSPEMEVEFFDVQDIFHFSSPAPDVGCGSESGDCTFNEVGCPEESGGCDVGHWFNPPCPAEWGGGPGIE